MPIRIYDYTDYRKYLKDWFEERQGRPSVRGFAKKVECSPSLLSSVMGGTRDLAAPLAEKVCAAMGLDAEEKTYFLDLVAMEQAETRAQRREAVDRVMAVRRFRSAPRIVDAMYLIFSRWYYPAIHELARCTDFREDPAWIARTLVPAITEAEAAEALEVLVAADFLVRGEDGRLRAANTTLATEHEVGRVAAPALVALNRWVFERAPDALEAFPADERHFGTLALALSASAVPELKKVITRFEEEVFSRFGALQDADRVYQVAVQCFPISAVTRS
ncbi:MAG: TIGR02147 family protein [Myxococcota bacterium]